MIGDCQIENSFALGTPQLLGDDWEASGTPAGGHTEGCDWRHTGARDVENIWTGSGAVHGLNDWRNTQAWAGGYT